MYTYDEMLDYARRVSAMKDAEINALRARLDYLEKVVSGQIELMPPAPIVLQVTPERARELVVEMQEPKDGD